MSVVDKSSRVPYYLQLAEILRQQVQSAVESADVSLNLPSENELAKHHRLSRATVRQALDLLEREGLITKQKGRGTFPSKPRQRYELTELIPTTDELTRRGWKPSVQVISAREMSASSLITKSLQLEPDARVYELCRLRLGNNEPISIQWSYLPVQYYPNLLSYNLTGSLTHLVEDQYGMRFWKAVEILRARSATAQEAKLLHIPPQSPVIYMQRITASEDDLPLEFLESVWRSDKYDFVFTLMRK
jgi:GntR family transcriptional regulator